MEGISLFGTVPHFVRVLREEGSPVILGTHSVSKAPIDSQVHALEGVPTQDVDGDGTADTEVHGVESVPAGAIPLADESKPFSFAYHPLSMYIYVCFFFDTSLPYLVSKWRDTCLRGKGKCCSCCVCHCKLFSDTVCSGDSNFWGSC